MEQVTCDKRTRSSSHERSSNAPWYRVPKQSIVSVEHPFIIKDIDKGLATLGNPGKVEEVSRIHSNMYQNLILLSWSKKMALPPVCI